MSYWKDLANAIILQAVTDYRKAAKKISKNPDNAAAVKTMKECENFFLSDWFTVLTDLDGQALLEKLKKEVTNYER